MISILNYSINNYRLFSDIIYLFKIKMDAVKLIEMERKIGKMYIKNGHGSAEMDRMVQEYKQGN